MADLNSAEYEKAYVSEPRTKLLPHELNGRIRREYSESVPVAEFAVAEAITLMKLPANAVLLEVRIVSGNLTGGAGGLLDIGWAAGADGKEAASADGIIANIATDGGAIDSSMGWSDAAFNKRFEEAVDLIGVFSVDATTTATAKTVQFEVRYVID